MLFLCLVIQLAVASLALGGSHEDTYDYVIAGGGTCGLVVASRLSENPNIRVAVIEAGDSVRFNSNVTNTTSYGLSVGTSIDWQYPVVPQEYAGNKTPTYKYNAGKALGGTSTINGMTYLRPEDAQIDLWEQLGNTGWNWSTLFSYSKRSETFEPPKAQQVLDGAAYDLSAHGSSGPLTVSFNPHFLTGDFHSIINDTWKSLGLPWKQEPNAGKLRGISSWPQTLDAKNDVRKDAARAYYYPVAERENLHVYVNMTASKIIWKEPACPGCEEASGLEIVDLEGTVKTLFAKKEVILSAGSLRTPVLLERSGIGAESILSKYRVKPVVNLPSVGENLQDQINLAFIALSNSTFLGYPTFVGFINASDIFGSETEKIYEQTLAQLHSYASLIATNSGNALSANVQEKLLRTQLDLIFKQSVPIAEILFAPTTTPALSDIAFPFWGLLPLSRGSVHMSGMNISDPPAINPNFFQFEFDRNVQVAIAKLIRKSLSTAPLAGIVTGEAVPGNAVLGNATDDGWISWMTSSYGPNYHPVGTAAMLPKELGGVVSDRLTIYGTANIRIVDASVLPFQVCGHLTSTLYAVAEKAADLIKATWNT